MRLFDVAFALVSCAVGSCSLCSFASSVSSMQACPVHVFAYLPRYAPSTDSACPSMQAHAAERGTACGRIEQPGGCTEGGLVAALPVAWDRQQRRCLSTEGR